MSKAKMKGFNSEEELSDLNDALSNIDKFWMDPIQDCSNCIFAAEGLIRLAKKPPPTRIELEEFVKEHFDYLGELEDFIMKNSGYLQELYQSDFPEVAEFAKNFEYLGKTYRTDFI